MHTMLVKQRKHSTMKILHDQKYLKACNLYVYYCYLYLIFIKNTICMIVYGPRAAASILKGPECGIDSLKLKIQDVLCYHIGARSQNPLFCYSNMCSELLSFVFSPLFSFSQVAWHVSLWPNQKMNVLQNVLSFYIWEGIYDLGEMTRFVL